MSGDLVAVQKELSKYINASVKTVFIREEDKTHPRYNELHPSSFPWCGLQQAYTEAAKIEKKPFDFYGDYYTGLGTFAHELMQKYLGFSGKIIGYWKCESCGKKHKSKVPTFAPSSCKYCKHTIFEYDEIGIKFRKYTHGHIDGVIKIKGKYYVIDYKTSSSKKNEEHRKFGNVYPYKKNIAQIESYTVYLEQTHKIKIAGWFLIYVSRDSSLKDFVIVGELVSKKKKEQLLKKLTRDDKLFGIVLKLRKNPKDMSLWSKLVKYKPCSSMADYKENMHSFDMCPLAEGGVCFNDSRLKREIKNLHKKVKVVNQL